MLQREWTTLELETLEAIELPTREAFTGLCGGLINIDLDLDVDVDVDVDIDLDDDDGCKNGGGGNGGNGGGGKCS